MQAFLDALYVRNESQRISGEFKSQKDIFDLVAENIEAGNELRSLHVELEAVKRDLEAEKEKTAELHNQLDGIAYKVMAKGRGELAIQHRNGLSSGWDIEGMIETYKVYCPEDFEEAVVEPTNDVEGDGCIESEMGNSPASAS